MMLMPSSQVFHQFSNTENPDHDQDACNTE